MKPGVPVGFLCSTPKSVRQGSYKGAAKDIEDAFHAAFEKYRSRKFG